MSVYRYNIVTQNRAILCCTDYTHPTPSTLTLHFVPNLYSRRVWKFCPVTLMCSALPGIIPAALQPWRAIRLHSAGLSDTYTQSLFYQTLSAMTSCAATATDTWDGYSHCLWVLSAVMICCCCLLYLFNYTDHFLFDGIRSGGAIIAFHITSCFSQRKST